MGCSLIFSYLQQLSETLSKMLLFLAGFSEKDKNGSDRGFLHPFGNVPAVLAAELLTG